MDKPLRSLYICYLSLEDPLVHTQVVAYLAGLAERGHLIHLLTYDRPLSPGRRAELERKLGEAGIVWHSLRYHQWPSLPATVYDVLRGAITAVRLVRRFALDAVHARNHVPLATALIARSVTRCKLIFDIRGLMAEEYVDAGRWRAGGVPFLLTKRVQAVGVGTADGIVTLTRAVQPHLFGPEPPSHAHVIPCCADLEALDAQADRREAVRRDLGIADRRVIVYVGKFTGWYMEREMAEFFAAARRVDPTVFFLILTQADRDLIRRELARAGVPEADYTITQAPPEEVGAYLAAGDLGISFIRRCFSKISSSPTKIGEYLGAGVPVVSTSGIGDVDRLLGNGWTGVLVDRFERDAFEACAARALELSAQRDTRIRCRALAGTELGLQEIGIPRYDRLYRQVAASADARTA